MAMVLKSFKPSTSFHVSMIFQHFPSFYSVGFNRTMLLSCQNPHHFADFAQIRESYRRSGVAKKYAREATHERRQRAVGSRWRWECMKDHPTSSFLFVWMLMDRLTSEVPGLPMDDDVCRVCGGESRV